MCKLCESEEEYGKSYCCDSETGNKSLMWLCKECFEKYDKRNDRLRNRIK